MRTTNATLFRLPVSRTIGAGIVERPEDGLPPTQSAERDVRKTVQTRTSFLPFTASLTRVTAFTATVQTLSALLLLLCGGRVLDAQTPPTISYAKNPRSQVVLSNAAASFVVQPSGSPPLSYQWLFSGHALANGTNRTFALSHGQPEDEGDYSVIVRNDWGAVTSRVARLTVIPLPTHLLPLYFTDTVGTRLPYRFFAPADQEAQAKYPLVMFLHGGSTFGTDNLSHLNPPHAMAYISYGNQVVYPSFFVAPQCAAEWSPEFYYALLGRFLDRLISDHPIDTNRIYITGSSAGASDSWDMLIMRPHFFAASVPLSGWGYAEAEKCRLISHVSLWNFHSINDDLISVNISRAVMNMLRALGGSAISTEYGTAGHNNLAVAYATPGLVDWTMAQRRGQPAAVPPQLVIERPSTNRIMSTDLASLDLSGTATCGQEPIWQVTVTNLATGRRYLAQGTDGWSARGILLKSGVTNTLVALAEATPGVPGFGGSTTFNATLIVDNRPPLAITIERQTGGVLLNWSGGRPPFALQSRRNLLEGSWTTIQENATPPVILPSTSDTVFYRVETP